MSDFLVDMGPTGRRVVSTLGLPIPLPQKLRRDDRPWQAQELMDRSVLVRSGPLAAVIANTLAPAGATVSVVGDEAPFAEAGEAWARAPQPVPDRVDNIVFDATNLNTPESLRAVYDLFHAHVRSLNRCAHVVVLGRPDGEDPVQAATAHALHGFVRSLAKEIGRKGSTANLLVVHPDADERVGPVLRFFLSNRSAFVTGQVLEVGRGGDAVDRASRPLEGKTALVTGSARGIGRATAAALAREGAKVIVLDRPADDGPASLTAQDIGGILCLVDITDPAAADKIREACGGTLDVLVHNAGVTRDKTLAKMDESRWDMTLDINLGAVMRVTEALDDVLADDARIICLSSIAGIAGNFGQTNYSASKSGVIGYVRALSPRLAHRGITVNAIAPGFIETRLTDAIPVATREVARRLSSLSQGGLPHDIAEVVTFFASPGSAGVTGQILRVCGDNLVGA